MKLYDRVADKFPQEPSPFNSRFSTPKQTTGQIHTFNHRLSALSSVPPAKKLHYLDSVIAKEVVVRTESKKYKFPPIIKDEVVQVKSQVMTRVESS